MSASLVLSSYPKVLFDFAKTKDKINIFYDQANWLIGILEEEDNKVYNFLKNLKLSKKHRKQFIEEVFESKLEEDFINLLKTMVDFNRCSYILSVVNNFLKICNSKLKIIPIDVYSAYELDEKQLKKIEASVIKKYKSKVSMNNIIDEELIGGIKIVTPTESIDNSLQSKLNLMRKSAYKTLYSVNKTELGD